MGKELDVFYNAIQDTANQHNVEMEIINPNPFLFNGQLNVFTRTNEARMKMSLVDREKLLNALYGKILDNASTIAFEGSSLTDNYLINFAIRWAMSNIKWDADKINDLRKLLAEKLQEKSNSNELINAVFFPSNISRRGNVGNINLEWISETLSNYAKSINPGENEYAIFESPRHK